MKDKQFWFVTLFMVMESILYFLILTTTGKVNTFVGFLGILLAFVFSLLFKSYSGVKNFTRAALLFTIISVAFLVFITPQKRIVAIIFFSVAQVCYFYRLLFYSMSPEEKRSHIKVRTLAIVLALASTLLILGEKADTLAVISIFYYTNLIINVLFAIVQYRVNIYFTLGLICFLICDTIIGLRVANGLYFNIASDSFIHQLIYSTGDILWMFYVPAQVLIALSLKVNRKVTVTTTEKS